MKRRNTISSHDLWKMAQSGQFDLATDYRELSDNQPISLTDIIEKLRHDPDTADLGDELTEYMNENYRDVLRRLERIDTSPHIMIVLLKILCLLQMDARNETIGNKRPREHLRDKVLKQFKLIGETDQQRAAAEWLESFCFGHELPMQFWSITND